MIHISKQNIRYTIISNEQTHTGKRSSIFNSETITYKENEETLVKFNIKKELLERENNDILIKYDFKKKEASIYLKELNNYIYPKLIIKEKTINKDKIDILFNIEDNTINYKIEVLK